MKIAAILALLLVGVTAAVEGITILRLRREVRSLSATVEELRREGSADDGPSPAERLAEGLRGAWMRPPPGGPSAAGPDTLGAPGSALPGGAGPAPFALPLPSAIATPEAREQLQKFVAAEMQRVRMEERDQWMGQREEREQALRDRAVKELGLNEEEARKVGELLGDMQNGRRTIFQAVRAGEKTPQEAQQEIAALRDKTQQGLKDTLGEDRTKKLQEIQRQERERSTGGGGAGGPFGFLGRR